LAVERPRLLSVAEAAAELDASEAYVRRLLLRQRLYGIKIGFVWAIFPEDLAAFKRTRRPPRRPRRPAEDPKVGRQDAGDLGMLGTRRKRG